MAFPGDSSSERDAHKRERGHGRHHADPEQAWLRATEADTPGGLLHAGDTSDEQVHGYATAHASETITPEPAAHPGYPQESGGTGQRHKKTGAKGAPTDHDTDDQHTD